MATGYIVWDVKNKKVVSGPYPTTAQADSAMARAFTKTASAQGRNGSQEPTFTRESVTV